MIEHLREKYDFTEREAELVIQFSNEIGQDIESYATYMKNFKDKCKQMS